MERKFIYDNYYNDRPANYPDFRGIIPIFIPQPESRYRDRKTSQNPDFHQIYPKKLLFTDFEVFLINFKKSIILPGDIL